MGYEVPASIGIRLADETRDVFAMVGDGGYLMMPTELVTAVQERRQGRSSCSCRTTASTRSARSRSRSGSQRFGTQLPLPRRRDGRLDGDVLPVDLAANARSLGAHVIEVHSRDELEKAIKEAKAGAGRRRPDRHPRRDRPAGLRARQRRRGGTSRSATVSELDSTQTAYAEYVDHKATQRPLAHPRPTRDRLDDPESAS